MSGSQKSPGASVSEAARSFDAELHTPAYARIHADAPQLERLITFLAPDGDQTLLDLGTGNGYVAMALARAQPACCVVGVDVAGQAIARDRESAAAQGLNHVSFEVYDGVMLPFADRHFDAAVSRYAFHHFPRPQTSLDELARCLRAGGRFALADAVRDDLDDVDFINRFQRLKPDGHVAMTRGADLVGMVQAHGFQVVDTFESSIAFTRARNADYDALLAATPETVLQAYAAEVADDKIHLRLRILNLLTRRGPV